MTGEDQPDPDARLVALLEAARTDGRRRVLGIAGAPGAGKSTLADAVASGRPEVAVVGMDGWHLANSTLERLGRRERKGAPDTFDAAGYVALLRRLPDRGTTIWAPEYRRGGLEEAVGGAVAVGPEVLVVVTEGNYLLLDEPPWDGVRPLLDEAWFVAPDEARRRERLIARHVRHGRDHADAVARADGPDGENARRVASTRGRADVVLPG